MYNVIIAPLLLLYSIVYVDILVGSMFLFVTDNLSLPILSPHRG